MTAPYFGSWNSVDDLTGNFEIDKSELRGAEVLFASYVQGGYEGSAIVVFRQNGKLYEVHGGHCSCNGLEGQWSPEEATADSLAKTIINHLRSEYSDADISGDPRLYWMAVLAELGADPMLVAGAITSPGVGKCIEQS
jgi:hypothetical protein